LLDSHRLSTSNYVLGEAITWLTYRQGRRQAISLYLMVQSALKTNLLEMQWVTPTVHEQAWAWYERFGDQVLSFCDCTSFAICQSGDFDFVFGFDRDFEIAGFQLRP
jgi:predicted nucleic acid-binding protein